MGGADVQMTKNEMRSNLIIKGNRDGNMSSYSGNGSWNEMKNKRTRMVGLIYI